MPAVVEQGADACADVEVDVAFWGAKIFVDAVEERKVEVEKREF